MGRPVKNNCDYYPHLCTMRNHRKIKALRNKFGSVNGYAFWSMFMEYLTELDGNVFEYSELEIELFAAELGVSATETKEMIEFCLKIELLFLKNGFIHSHSLDEKLKPVYEKRNRLKDLSATQKRRENGKYVSNSEAIGVTVTETTDTTDDTVDEMRQIELNRIKGNKTEGNDLFLSFDFFWDLYDKKVGKFKCEKKWKKLTDEEKEKIYKTLPNWLKNIKNKQFQMNPETYLNGKHWEDEIIIHSENIGSHVKSSVDKATAKQIAENEKLASITPASRKAGWDLED